MDLADFRGRAGQNEINNKRVMIGAYSRKFSAVAAERLDVSAMKLVFESTNQLPTFHERGSTVMP